MDKKDEITEILADIGNPAFIPILDNLLESEDLELQQIGVEILQNMAVDENGNDKSDGIETQLDPEVDVETIMDMTNEELQDIALNNEYSMTRAIALYYLNSEFRESDFLKDYVFEEGENGLFVEGKNITKLEMAVILDTGVPGEDGWWEQLADKDERKKYVGLIFKGDFTDERRYIGYPNIIKGSARKINYRNWVCVQYATQFVINAIGYEDLLNEDSIADEEAFLNYGAGYVISDTDYGVPVYYARADDYNQGNGHAFNAVFIGDGEITDNPDDWIFYW